MSLRAFHVIFIVCSIFLAVGFGCWAIHSFRQLHGFGYLWTGIGSFILAIGLAVYEFLFLKNVKD